MRKCPRCKEKTLRMKAEVVKQISPQSIGECFNMGYWRTMDDWSLISAKCVNPKCGYFR
jgi:hypothetical protein